MNAARCLLSLFACGALASPSVAQSHYVLDDGEIDITLGFNLPADYGWMQRFQTAGASDLITDVEITIPGITDGRPVTICVWDDPTEDGDPIDGQLVGLVAGRVQAAPGYASYHLASPALVQGRFFVGAFLSVQGWEGPAAIDKDTAISGVAWATWNYTVGGFDPHDLGNNFPPFHVETVGSMFKGVFLIRAHGTGDVPTVYCAAKTNSLGCAPEIGSTGVPSATSGSGFAVNGDQVRNRKTGLLIYGTSGRASVPFGGGTLCVAQPLQRTPAIDSGGTPFGEDCSGHYGFDFNAWIAAGFDPALVAGTTVDAQYWSRDPGFPIPDNVGLTAGLEFVIGP